MSAARTVAVARAVFDLWADAGRRTSLPAEGLSMWPILRPGDRLVIRHGSNPPSIGDIVVLWSGDGTIAHRIVARRTVGACVQFRTKGDLSLVADPGWVPEERIVGIVEGVSRRGVTVHPPGIGGPWARVRARLSRIQGLVCAPLFGLGLRVRVRKEGGS